MQIKILDTKEIIDAVHNSSLDEEDILIQIRNCKYRAKGKIIGYKSNELAYTYSQLLKKATKKQDLNSLEIEITEPNEFILKFGELEGRFNIDRTFLFWDEKKKKPKELWNFLFQYSLGFGKNIKSDFKYNRTKITRFNNAFRDYFYLKGRAINTKIENNELSVVLNFKLTNSMNQEECYDTRRLVEFKDNLVHDYNYIHDSKKIYNNMELK